MPGSAGGICGERMQAGRFGPKYKSPASARQGKDGQHFGVGRSTTPSLCRSNLVQLRFQFFPGLDGAVLRPTWSAPHSEILMTFRVFAILLEFAYDSPMHCYEWKTIGEERYQLIDVVSRRPVASIEQVGGVWHWMRNTTISHQGAPSAAGEATTLAEAQAAVLNGLPNER